MLGFLTRSLPPPARDEGSAPAAAVLPAEAEEEAGDKGRKRSKRSLKAKDGKDDKVEPYFFLAGIGTKATVQSYLSAAYLLFAYLLVRLA
jgi:hypothetical protein